MRRPDYLACVYDNVKSDKLKFCFDSGHQNCYPHSKDLDLLSLYGDKLISLHLHDNNGAIALEVTKSTGYENLSCKEFLMVAYDRARRLEELRYGHTV